MKICFVLEYYFPNVGGAETLFKNLAEGLAGNGHECFVVTSGIPGAKSRETINGVNVRRVKLPRFLNRYWFAIFSIPAVYRIAKDCDILHTMIYNGALPTFIASRLSRTPSVITVFEVLLDSWKMLFERNWLNARLHALLERFILAMPHDRYICISNHTREKARSLGIDNERLLTIYPGVDYNLFSSQKTNTLSMREETGLRGNFVYLYFGRPGFSKGMEYLLRAVPLIAKKIPTSKLMLILSSAQKDRFKRTISLIKKLKIADRVLLLESVRRSELPKYISACDCVVIPSLTEGFCFSCVEACSMGKPVVATDVGAIPEVIFGSYNLIAPRSPEDICRGVEDVYSGKFMTGPRRVFEWAECISRHEEVYDGLLDRRGRIL